MHVLSPLAARSVAELLHEPARLGRFQATHSVNSIRAHCRVASVLRLRRPSAAHAPSAHVHHVARSATGRERRPFARELPALALLSWLQRDRARLVTCVLLLLGRLLRRVVVAGARGGRPGVLLGLHEKLLGNAGVASGKLDARRPLGLCEVAFVRGLHVLLAQRIERVLLLDELLVARVHALDARRGEKVLRVRLDFLVTAL